MEPLYVENYELSFQSISNDNNLWHLLLCQWAIHFRLNNTVCYIMYSNEGTSSFSNHNTEEVDNLEQVEEIKLGNY